MMNDLRAFRAVGAPLLSKNPKKYDEIFAGGVDFARDSSMIITLA